MLRRLAPLALLVSAFGCGLSTPAADAPPPQAAAATAAPEAPAPAPQIQGAEDGADPSRPSPRGAPPPAEAAPVPLGAPPKPPGAATPSPSPTSVDRADIVKSDAPLLGTITQADVMAQVNKRQELFDKCYVIGAGASKSWRAKVTVKASVGPSGAIGSAEVVSSTTKNPKVDACVLDAFRKLTFPRPAGAGATTFTFPFSFDGMEQVQ